MPPSWRFSVPGMKSGDDVRQHGDAAEEERAAERDPVRHAPEELLGRLAGPDAGDEAAVLAQVVGGLVGPELERGVEVREEDDQPEVERPVQRDVVLAVQVRADPGRHVAHPVDLAGGEVGGDLGREEQDADGEDDRDHAGHRDLQRQVLGLCLEHPSPPHAARVLDRDAALALVDEDDRGDDHDRDHDERDQPRQRVGAADDGADLLRHAADDAGEDDEADAVADARAR